MTDARDDHEPSMEEILSSIRRIIAEEDNEPQRPAARQTAETTTSEAESSPASAQDSVQDDEDVLDLSGADTFDDEDEAASVPVWAETAPDGATVDATAPETAMHAEAPAKMTDHGAQEHLFTADTPSELTFAERVRTEAMNTFNPPQEQTRTDIAVASDDLPGDTVADEPSADEPSDAVADDWYRNDGEAERFLDQTIEAELTARLHDDEALDEAEMADDLPGNDLPEDTEQRAFGYQPDDMPAPSFEPDSDTPALEPSVSAQQTSSAEHALSAFAEEAATMAQVSVDHDAEPAYSPALTSARSDIPEFPTSDTTMSKAQDDTVLHGTPQEELVSGNTAGTTMNAFAKIGRRQAPDYPAANDPRSMNEVVTDMIRPMLKEWLDENLPGIVERLVEREINKMARRAEMIDD